MRSFKIKEIREIKGEKINLFNLFKKELFANILSIPEKEIKEIEDLTDSVFTEIEKNIFMPYFFEYAKYTNRLKAEIQETMLEKFSKLPNIVLKRNDLIEKIIDLSKSIYLKSVKNEYIIDIIEVPTLSEYAALNRARASTCKTQNNAQNAVDSVYMSCIYNIAQIGDAKNAVDDVYNSAKMHAGSVLINQR